MIHLMKSFPISAARFFIVFLSSAVFYNCGLEDQDQADDPRKIGQPVEFSAIDADSNSGVQNFKTVLIRDSTSWDILWAEHKQYKIPIPDAPAVDFSQQMVIGVFLEFRPNGCYSVNITSIRSVEGQKLLVIYHENTPSSKSVCTAEITHPSHIVSVEKSDLPVEFIGR